MPRVEKILPLPHLLNEASFQCFDSRAEFVRAMQGVMAVVRKMCGYGYAAQLSCSRSLMDCACYGDVSFREWLRDSDCICPDEAELRRFMRQSVTKVPFLEDAYPVFYEDSLFDVYRDGERIYMNAARTIPAFVVSLCFRLPTIALKTGEFSAEDRIELVVKEMRDDGSDCETTEQLFAFSDVSQVERNAEWLENRIAEEVEDSFDFSRIREAMFPSLLFSKEVDKALSDRKIDFAHVPVLRELLRLQNAFCRMQREHIPFRDAYGRVRTLAMTESESTQAHRESSRTFTWSDGARTCYPHVKIGSCFRIHFLPDQDVGFLYVGYMGKHLPTG